jgi:hypothetical protein
VRVDESGDDGMEVTDGRGTDDDATVDGAVVSPLVLRPATPGTSRDGGLGLCTLMVSVAGDNVDNGPEAVEWKDCGESGVGGCDSNTVEVGSDDADSCSVRRCVNFDMAVARCLYNACEYPCQLILRTHKPRQEKG